MGLRRSPDVTERDAFGNPVEDARPTTAPLTGGDPLATGPVSDPPASGLEAEPSPMSSDPSTRPRRGLLGGGCGCLVSLLFLAPFLAGGWFVYRTFTDSVSPAVGVINDVRDAVREQTKTATDDQPAADPPRGLGQGSLLRPAAVDAMLRKVRADPGGKLLLLRLAPERADLQLRRKGGGLAMVQLRFDGGRSIVGSPGTSGSKAITFSKIDRGAPQRLVRGAAERLGRKPSSIDYLVLIDVLGGPQWSAYFSGGAAFQGDAHGRVVRRIQ